MSERRTMSDIARLAGVSPTAVSFALNGRNGLSDATRRHILAVADEYGWFPSAAARALTGSRTGVVGLVLSRTPRQLSVHPFQLAFIAGLEAQLSTSGYSLLLHIAEHVDDEHARYRRWHAEGRVDGVVLLDLRTEDSRLALLGQLSIPGVVVGDPRFAGAFPAVWSHDATAIAAAVDRLVALGHRRIARISEAPEMGYATVRNEAFLEACARHGVSAARIAYANTEEAGAVTTELLTTEDPPTALLFETDIAAIAGLRAVHSLGLSVPADVSLIAYDDSLICEVTQPPLSAVSRDVYELGAHTATALMAVVGGSDSPVPELDGVPTLVERGSTGPAPARPPGGRRPR